jgi:hypothetical protein
MVLAFTDDQLAQIKTAAFQVPHPLRAVYLRRLAELLPSDFGDADVYERGRRLTVAPRAALRIDRSRFAPLTHLRHAFASVCRADGLHRAVPPQLSPPAAIRRDVVARDQARWLSSDRPQGRRAGETLQSAGQ